MASISATTATQCLCCGITPTLECRIKGGTASLCGYQEYVSPSSPPKKYRVQTYNQDRQDCSYTGTGCSASPHGSTRATVTNATSTYNASTCSPTQSGNELYGGEVVGGACADYTGSLPNSQPANAASADLTGAPALNGFSLDTSSATYLKYVGTNTCTTFGGNSDILRGTLEWALSTEDTEADAIARVQAGSWGSWQTVGGGCSNPACCLAKYETRTSGFSFGYEEAQFRVTKSGLAPSTNYEAWVEIYRRSYGSGSYTHYQTMIVSGTSDGSGNLTITGDVPNDQGYETYAQSALIFLA